MKDKLVKKEVDNQTTDGTSLEILEGEIDPYAKSKKTKEEKEQLNSGIQDYLRGSLEKMQGVAKDKEKHPAYQKMLIRVNEFITTHNLMGAGWKNDGN